MFPAEPRDIIAFSEATLRPAWNDFVSIDFFWYVDKDAFHEFDILNWAFIEQKKTCKHMPLELV